MADLWRDDLAARLEERAASNRSSPSPETARVVESLLEEVEGRSILAELVQELEIQRPRTVRLVP